MMTSREWDTQIAEWLGYRRVRYLPRGHVRLMPSDLADELLGHQNFIEEPDALYIVEYQSEVEKFSDDLNAMARVLAVVKERGLDDGYIKALVDVVAGPYPHLVLPSTVTWSCINASASQQVEALIRMIQEGER